MKSEIKKKYKSLDDKMGFVQRMAEVTGLNVFSIKNHHLGGDFNIPEKWHKLYLKELNRAIKRQKVA